MRETWRKDVLGEMFSHVDEQYPDLASSNPILRTILADELADLVQLREYLNRIGGPVGPRGHAYKVADMKRAKARDVKDTIRLIALEQGKVGAQGEAFIYQIARARRQRELAAENQ